MGGVVVVDFSVSPSPIPFPLDFGFGIWDLDLGSEFGTWIWDLDLGLDLGLTIKKGRAARNENGIMHFTFFGRLTKKLEMFHYARRYMYVSFSLSRCGACLGHHFKGNVMIENLT